MMEGGKARELWGVPQAHTGSYTLAVLSDDDTLAAHVIALLEREGLQIRLEVNAARAEALASFDRRPTLVIIRYEHDRRSLDRALRGAQRRLAGAIVVVVIPPGDSADLGLTLTNGADALVREEDMEAVLGPVVRAAAGGQSSAPAGLLRLTQPPALSHRERQILGLALAGLSNAQIAERLYLAPSTVKTHISAAYRRLGVHSRREATRLVFATDDALRRTVLATLRLSEEYAPSPPPAQPDRSPAARQTRA
jgi:DNA-binding NarL/FixJ family response regulator